MGDEEQNRIMKKLLIISVLALSSSMSMFADFSNRGDTLILQSTNQAYWIYYQSYFLLVSLGYSFIMGLKNIGANIKMVL